MRDKTCGIHDLGREDKTRVGLIWAPDVERPGRGASRPGLGSTWGLTGSAWGSRSELDGHGCSNEVFPPDFADCFNCFVADHFLAGPKNVLAGSGRSRIPAK